jgi:hypothetical protein
MVDIDSGAVAGTASQEQMIVVRMHRPVRLRTLSGACQAGGGIGLAMMFTPPR